VVVEKTPALKPLVHKGCSAGALNRSLRRLFDLTNAMAWGQSNRSQNAIEELLGPSSIISLFGINTHLLDI